jgi:hypothetical protein
MVAKATIRNIYNEHSLRNTSSSRYSPYSFGGREGILMGSRVSVEMYLCAFYLGKWEPDENVEDAYHRALKVTPDQFHDLRKDDDGAMQEKHADAIHRHWLSSGPAGSLIQAASLRLRPVKEARKGGMRFPA